MFFNKLALLALVAFAAYVSADMQITDWCPPCKRLIDDFADMLKTPQVQDIYLRSCNDIYLDDKESNQKCQEYNTKVYTNIRNWLNAGQSAEQVCTSLQACPSNQPQQRSKSGQSEKERPMFQPLSTGWNR